MPTFAYLKDYGLEVTPSGIYKLTFAIPNNCNYRSTSISGTSFCITIELNSGQHAPSTVFMMEEQDYSIAGDNIRLEFSQPDQAGKRRPILDVQG